MDDEFGESIEFQAMNADPQVTSQIRHSFRIPLNKFKKNITIIKNFPYPLVDISNGGIAFEIKYETEFMAGDILEGCRLLLGNVTFEGLRAEVVHLTPESDITWICGIRWIDLEKNDARRIKGIVQNFRKELFADGTTPPARDLELKR